MNFAVSQLTDDYEIILVDDGSPDNSLQMALSLSKDYPCRVVELSRNFGHHPAILAGLSEAKGEYVFLIDSDLEEPPELIGEFWNHCEGVDVVFGVHNRSGKSFLNRISGSIFWGLISAVSNVKIERNIANVRLMRRKYVRALLSMPDRNVFLGGMFAWPGFKQISVPIVRLERLETSYSIGKRFQLAFAAAISFSTKPLLYVFFMGISITLLSMLFAAFLIIRKIFDPSSLLGGFTSLMISIWFLGGLIMGSIGVLGFYIAHVYDQARERPRFIIRDVHEDCE